MELIYVTDPLCMWSHAFSPVLKKFVERHENEFFTSVVCSGMVRGDLVTSMATQSDKLWNAAQAIEKKSGMSFGDKFYKNLHRDDIYLNSVPGSTAVNGIKQLDKENALTFSMDISNRIFQQGISPDDKNAIASIMEHYNFNYNDSINYLNSDNGKYIAFQDFQWFEAANLRGTPVLILDVNGELVQLNQGYITLDKLEQVYDEVTRKFDFSMN